MKKSNKVQSSVSLSLHDNAVRIGAADGGMIAIRDNFRSAVKTVSVAVKKGEDAVSAAKLTYKTGHREGYMQGADPAMREALSLTGDQVKNMPADKDKATIMALRETGQSATNMSWSRVYTAAKELLKPKETAKETPTTAQPDKVTPEPVAKGPDSVTSEADKARSEYLQTINRATTKDLPLLQCLAWAAQNPAQFLKVITPIIPVK